MLPTLGKLYDKILTRRLQTHLERTGNLNERQFAYRTGIGTIDALRGFMDQVNRTRRDGRHLLVVALDLAKAFNSAWLPYIRKRLEQASVGSSLAGACMAFLRSREIKSGNIVMAMEKGCPQGSSLGMELGNGGLVRRAPGGRG